MHLGVDVAQTVSAVHTAPEPEHTGTRRAQGPLTGPLCPQDLHAELRGLHSVGLWVPWGRGSYFLLPPLSLEGERWGNP